MTLPQGQRICAICRSAPGKYKCEKCRIPFCSVPCSRTHRTAPGSCNPLPPPPPPPGPKSPSSSPRQQKRPPHPFAALESSPELPALFAQYPNLPSLLLSIDAAMAPPTLEQQAKAQAEAALRIAEGQYKSRHRYHGHSFPCGRNKSLVEPWTRDIGLSRGKEALNRLRDLEGKDGEAVRAYAELVLRLVGREVGDDGRGDNFRDGREEYEHDVAGLLRRKLDEEDARMIEDFLRKEDIDMED